MIASPLPTTPCVGPPPPVYIAAVRELTNRHPLPPGATWPALELTISVGFNDTSEATVSLTPIPTGSGLEPSIPVEQPGLIAYSKVDGFAWNESPVVFEKLEPTIVKVGTSETSNYELQIPNLSSAVRQYVVAIEFRSCAHLSCAIDVARIIGVISSADLQKK